MKTVRLRVLASGEVRLSVPAAADDAWIAAFLQEKRAWIEQNVQTMQARHGDNAGEDTLHSFSVLGHSVPIVIQEGSKRLSGLSDDMLRLYVANVEDRMQAEAALHAWWYGAARDCYMEIIARMMPIFVPHGVSTPHLTVRAMKSLWGSCSRSRGKITINAHLYKAPMPCVEYVILHELTHFLYPRHDAAFYGFVAQYMPDYAQRKATLESAGIVLI